MKSNIAFALVVVLAFALIAFYFASPLSAPPQKEHNNEKRQESQVLQSLPTQAEEERIPAAEKPTPDQNTDIPKSSSVKAVVRYYTKPSVPNLKYLTVYINETPTEMIFDTGASFIAVNSPTIRQLGISAPLTRSITNTAAGPTDAYLFDAATIRIGTISLNNVQCSYLPRLSENLLGGSFLSNFHYYINERNHTITFIPYTENVQITGDAGIDTVEGRGWAEVDGKKFIYREGRFEKQ